jgi:hypothetical protein
MNLPDLLNITTFVLDMLTDIHHSLQKSSRESNLISFALDCFTSVFKYCYRLDSSTNFLLKSAYIENKFLHSQGCDTWYSGLQRLFKILDNNTGIHNMLKYKHNTFKRKNKVYTKVIGFEYLPVSIFNLWLLILNLVKDFL